MLASALMALSVTACSAQAGFPDTRIDPGMPLAPEDYSGAFALVLDPRDAPAHNEDLGMPVDVTVQSPAGPPGAMEADGAELQTYHVELFVSDGAITRCTVQDNSPDGDYTDASCRRTGHIVQIVVSGTEAGRLIFELAKPEAGGLLSGRGFLQHPVLPVSPSIGSVTLTPAAG
ncbi:hypothetical protein F1654_05705 [Alkalicaulis satelles]|uniref:Uncharacterized protein n=1 Tax=Alkalicaulis satelles TaxID=2609175 RepID=A0A5M6ZJ90_9PROT|nr:hypothetical protein [Alkalicaulis satelles]KAA5803308.1 hypothetical protein F1654_05705 [Alkalicaulis satelles]